ncbi:Abi family protein [Arthrobacter sp. A2-55]|uniref:Abi family protein n=1 Tax=Arthrobacter sp. A2-55 TaxID=2897337 RepID=UPI0021CD6AA0|nr:Abi family protein [Arthrobacter sp. A2-55]MCU6479510.1 Abi family protein [Arthrobacter sp. A2-55]
MDPKPHKSYSDQLDLLKRRGMHVEDTMSALALLQRAGYYTLSGYSYPFRLKAPGGARTGQFRPGTSLAQVQSLWEFDNRLRSSTFAVVQHVETYLRALMGYALGAVDPLIHRKPGLLSIDRSQDYPKWLAKLDRQEADSREDFIIHHRNNRHGIIPIWVAVDVLDWGGLSYLFSFAPLIVRDEVAQHFGLNAAQLKSWLRALNVLRNVCAHHGRFYNRYYSLTPKLPDRGHGDSLEFIAPLKDTTFAMLTLLQHLASFTLGANPRLLPATLRSFPTASGMTIGSTGAREGWESLSLWHP